VRRRLWNMNAICQQKMLLQELTEKRKALKLQEKELHKRQQQPVKKEKLALNVGLILFILGNAFS
jgi:hypothetical protein